MATIDQYAATDAAQSQTDANPDAAAIKHEAMLSLARYVNECFDVALHHALKERNRFMEALYARRGEYPPAKLAQIRETGGSEEYARICAHKSRVLQAWLEDVYMANAEKPWTLEPTPAPSLSQEATDRIKAQVSEKLAALVAQGQAVDPITAEAMLADELDMERTRQRDTARARAERMADVISDQLNEGGFAAAFATFLSNFVTYPGAVLKGPVFRKRSKILWDNVDGAFVPKVSEEVVMQFDAPDPFNCYPSPGSTNPQEGFFIEHLKLSARDLYGLIGVDGYNEANIRTVLGRAQRGSYAWVDTRTAAMQPDAATSRADDKTNGIDVLEFHGPVLGRDLREWGLQVDVDDQRYYEASVWLINDIVIKATLNDDPLGRRPYYKACYEEVPNQFWGHSMYDVLRDVQGVANAAIRALVNNMALSSGPQVVVNTTHLPADTDVTNITPMRVWLTVDPQFNTTAQSPISFFQPPSNAQELLAVVERFYSFADDFSSIPRYMAGSDRVSGPARTASGLSMLLDAANKGLKSIVQNIDLRVMSPLLTALFDHNMIYHEDSTIKGDAQVVARGVASLMQLETLRMRRNEFLQITANPIDSQIVGMQGRAAILRESAKTLGMDVNKIVPPDRTMSAAGMQAPQAPAAPSAAAQMPQAPQQSQETLASGAPVTDFTSPRAI